MYHYYRNLFLINFINLWLNCVLYAFLTLMHGCEYITRLKCLQKGFHSNVWPCNFLDKYGYHCFIITELFDMNRIGPLAYINALDSIIMDALYFLHMNLFEVAAGDITVTVHTQGLLPIFINTVDF